MSNERQAASFNAYQWLQSSDGRSCAIVHFHALGGLGHYTTTAKRQGLFSAARTLVVSVHSPSAPRLDRLNKPRESRAPAPLVEDLLIHEFMQRTTAENAVSPGDPIRQPRPAANRITAPPNRQRVSPRLTSLVGSQDVLVTPNNWLAQFLVNQERWVLPTDTRQIPNVVHPFPLNRATEVGVVTSELVFAGRLSLLKGIDVFCDAVDIMRLSASGLRGLRSVTFLGRATDPVRRGLSGHEYVMRRAQDWGPNVTVKVLPDLSSAQALEYLAGGKGRVAVMPSRFEVAPMMVAEALRARVPFIAADFEGTRGLVDPTGPRALLVPPGNAKRLAEAMRESLETVLWPQRKLPRIHPSVRRASDQWKELHRSIVNSPAPHPLPSKRFPAVSVVIVHHERPRLLRQAIESIERQR